MNLDDIPDNLSSKDLLKYLVLETRQQKQELQNSIENLTRTVHTSEQKILQLEEENKQLKQKIRDLARKDKKNNIIIFGVQQEQNEIITELVINLFKRINVEVNLQDINNVYRFGKSNIRPIIVELTTYLKKHEIIKSGYKLKGSNIAISNDLIQEDRESNNILRQHLKSAREKQLSAKIKNNKLYVGEEVYTAEQLNDLDKQNEALNIDTDPNYISETHLSPRSSSTPNTPTTFMSNNPTAESNIKKIQTNRNPQKNQQKTQDTNNTPKTSGCADNKSNNQKSRGRTGSSSSNYTLRNSKNLIP